MPQGQEGFSSREVAQFILELDATITSWRQTTYVAPSATNPTPLPIRPNRIELSVLTALAQTYGRAIVEDQRFLPVLDYIAECGAVVLVQRALWGEQFEDLWLGKHLSDARLAFEILCGTWPEVFFVEAHTALARLGLPVLRRPMFRDLPPATGVSDAAEDRDG